MSYALGIDLGTTYTAAAVRRDGRAEVAGLGVRSLEIPSVVFLREDGEFLVGEAAERRGQGEPGRLAREFKRRIGDPAPILLAGSPHSPQSLMARLLRAVFDTVVAREGGPPEALVVTCPANWGPFKRDLLAQAARLADVGPVTLATEPECAAIHYASTTRVAPGTVVAVYDLGGGTFDAAVLRKTEDGFEMVGAPEGIEHLGGIDFDEAVFSYALEALGDAVGPLERADPPMVAALARLRRECTNAKEALSVDSDTAIPVVLPDLQTEIRLTRREFEAMIRPALGDTLAAMRRALRSASLAPSDVKAVVLVGGSSRIPVVGELVAHELGIPVAVDTHPKHSVALGAAQLAGLRPASADVVPTPATPMAGSWTPPRSAAAAPPPPPVPATTLGASAGPPLPRDAVAPDTASAALVVPVEAAPSAPAPPPVPSPAPAPAPPPDPTPVPVVPADLPPDGPRTRRPLLIALGVLAVVAVVGVVVALSGGGGGEDQADATTTSTSVAGEAIVVPASSVPFANDVVLIGSLREGNDWDVYAIGADGSSERAVVDTDAAEFLPVWSADRRSIAFTRLTPDRDASELVVAAADGKDPIVVTDELQTETRAALSPDGTMVAFESERDGAIDMYLFDLRDSRIIQVTDDAVAEGDPSWSPDGQQIVFWRQAGEGRDLYTLQVGGSNLLVAGGPDPVEKQLTDGRGLDFVPEWSPDGSAIIYASTRDGNTDIYAIPAAGGEDTRLTDDPANELDPSWSPDGRRFAFTSDRDGGDREVYVASADGSNVRRVTNRPGVDAHPSWARR